MIRVGLIGFFFFVFLADMAAQEPDPFFSDKMADADSRSFLKKAEFAEPAGYSNYNLIYQRMEWEVDPAVRFIAGKITSYVISEIDSLSTIEFDLHDEMQVDSVVIRNEPGTFLRSENKLITDFHVFQPILI